MLHSLSFVLIKRSVAGHGSTQAPTSAPASTSSNASGAAASGSSTRPDTGHQKASLAIEKNKPVDPFETCASSFKIYCLSLVFTFFLQF